MADTKFMLLLIKTIQNFIITHFIIKQKESLLT
jgi:hypothetical protein